MLDNICIDNLKKYINVIDVYGVCIGLFVKV